MPIRWEEVKHIDGLVTHLARSGNVLVGYIIEDLKGNCTVIYRTWNNLEQKVEKLEVAKLELTDAWNEWVRDAHLKEDLDAQ